MRLRSLLTSGWFSCTLLTLLIAAGMVSKAPLLQSLDNRIFDHLSVLHKAEHPDRVTLIAIDQDSIGRIGSWPWPRSVIANAINRLAAAGVKTIGVDLSFPTREANDGIKEISRLKESLDQKGLNLSKKAREKLGKDLASAEQRLDNDAQLIKSVTAAGNVVTPIRFSLGSREWDDSSREGSSIKAFSIEYPKETQSVSQSLFQLDNPFRQNPVPVEATGFSAPFEGLRDSSARIGHDNFIPDPDGVVRSANLFISWQNRLYPSLALQLALASADTPLPDLRGIYSKDAISSLNFANMDVPVSSDYRMILPGGENEQFTTLPFHVLREGKISKELLQNKVAVIGLTASGLTSVFQTSDGNGIGTAELTAATTAAILSGSHISRPAWTWALEMGALLYFGLFLILIIPRVNLSLGATILVIFIAFWQGLTTILFVSQGIWVKSGSPTLLAVLGLIAIMINRRFFNPFRTATDDESNKVLGLSFQSQGLLDLALEKFMKCPISDPAVKDLLYNLALDMERKRMHNKAKGVYEHIFTCGPYKDIEEKIKRLQVTANLPSLSAGNGKGMDLTDGTTPTFGRYEIIRELGQGAIGTVYLGRDPKINREVAIKTLRYDQVDSTDLAEVKERFFREAEAAGKLNHPNIVTIYDIDEDHDMTYMAMELLDGTDLTGHCKKGNLLSVPNVLRIIIKVAEALEYAHKHHVVHRDIKPANIILLKDGGVKVADFGIARILTSSKTQTGIILGTPNYMSPEQVAGKKVDGRSDQFSLGVVFYELLTGTKPFQNPNIAALMHSIATVSYTPLQDVDPALPECCVTLASRLMSKAKSRRFADLGEVAAEAKKCLRQFRKK